MKGWRRLFSWVWRAVALLAVLSLGLYAAFVLPNDSRMHQVQPEPGSLQPITRFVKLQTSLLGANLEHHENIDAAAFKAKRDLLTRALPDYALPASSRFISPYQIYVPVGSYPLKLDAQDGLFIPGGATLTVTPGFAGEASLRFAVFSPQSAATLSYGVDAAAPFKLDLAPPPNLTFDASSQFYKGFWRFFEVDPRSSIEAWTQTQQDVHLEAGAKVHFTCSGAVFGCVLGDVQFYVPDTAPPRNVLIVLVDTLRADAIDAGNAPHMQDLAAQSVDFTKALAPGNMTSPSTNALLSCRRPSQLGELAFAYGMSNDFREGYYRGKQRSFPERFLKAGYDTAMIGNVSVISEIYGVGVSHGFARQISLETDGYDTPAIARDATQWLSRHGDHPFLLYLHFNGPHAPYRAPLRDIVRTFPGFAALYSYPETLKWLYQSEVSYTDRYLDVVLKALADLGLAANTTVVLTADHGDQHTEHRFLGNQAGPDFTGAYFDHGATLLNDEIHVPFMIREPGVAARRVAQYVSTLDLGPTLLDLSAHLPAEGCATQPLTPYMRGQDPAALGERTLGSEGFRGRAILFGNRYKYIRTYEPTDKRIYSFNSWNSKRSLYQVSEQLFDLLQDPDEEQDLAGSDPARLAEAQRLYLQLFAIRDSYELVVETPKEGQVTIDLAEAAKVEFEEGTGQVAATGAGSHITASGRTRYLLEVKGALTAVPQVTINGQTIAVKMTSMRLPLSLRPGDLPAEMGGRYTLLDPEKEAVAYLRKVEDDGQKNRHMMTGNPAFEKVLREWGYLNDK